jgi:hypothetical protein
MLGLQVCTTLLWAINTQFWLFFLLLSFKSSLYLLDNSLDQMYLLQIFLPVCGWSSYSLDIIFHRAETFDLTEVQLINYFLHEQ